MQYLRELRRYLLNKTRKMTVLRIKLTLRLIFSIDTEDQAPTGLPPCLPVPQSIHVSDHPQCRDLESRSTASSLGSSGQARPARDASSGVELAPHPRTHLSFLSSAALALRTLFSRMGSKGLGIGSIAAAASYLATKHRIGEIGRRQPPPATVG